MGKLKNLFRNINLLNIILIAVIFILGNYTILPSYYISAKYTLPTGKKTIDGKDERTVESHIPSLGEYAIIGDQNLFHPTRSIISAKEEKPEPKPEFILYGTMISDNLKLAYIEDRKSPRNTPGRGERQTALRIGDTMSGFTLKEIDTDKVVMVRGEENMVIKVIDPAAKKERRAQITPQPQTAPPIPKVRKP